MCQTGYLPFKWAKPEWSWGVKEFPFAWGTDSILLNFHMVPEKTSVINWIFGGIFSLGFCLVIVATENRWEILGGFGSEGVMMQNCFFSFGVFFFSGRFWGNVWVGEVGRCLAPTETNIGQWLTSLGLKGLVFCLAATVQEFVWVVRIASWTKLCFNCWGCLMKAHNGCLCYARWRQTLQVNFHCLHKSEDAHIAQWFLPGMSAAT